MTESIDWEQLQRLAREALPRAYAPYSEFRVAAALLAEDGRIFTGVNVENASYGLTVCAERNAVAAAVLAGARRFRAIVVTCSGPKPPTPCGACRQVLAEFPPAFTVRSIGADGATLDFATTDLLPAPFGPADL
ncbi:MAG: cytidine deaminase [Myxococcales bacterium]|jgi:cytidine deaminase